MIEYQAVEVQKPSAITCDKCGLSDDPKGMEGQEFLSHRDRAGYGSVFGDGRLVAIDLCQRCVKEVLGPWLKVTPQ